MIRRLARLGVAGLIAGLAMMVGASPAFAHAQFESSDPADGSSLATGPQTVKLTFSDTMRPNSLRWTMSIAPSP